MPQANTLGTRPFFFDKCEFKMIALFFTTDLLFSSRVTNIARECGMDMSVVRNREALLQRLCLADASLVLLDLGTCGANVRSLVPELRNVAPAPISIVAFGAHVDEATLSAAREGGCDDVFTRGQFNSQMMNIMKRCVSETALRNRGGSEPSAR